MIILWSRKCLPVLVTTITMYSCGGERGVIHACHVAYVIEAHAIEIFTAPFSGEFRAGHSRPGEEEGRLEVFSAMTGLEEARIKW